MEAVRKNYLKSFPLDSSRICQTK